MVFSLLIFFSSKIILYLLQGKNASKQEVKKSEPNSVKDVKLEGFVKNSNNNKALLGTIGRRVAVIKSQYAAIQQMSKEFQCYSQNCSKQNANSCYSPSCLQLVRLRRELLMLLRKTNSTRNNNNMINNKIEEIKKGTYCSVLSKYMFNNSYVSS